MAAEPVLARAVVARARALLLAWLAWMAWFGLARLFFLAYHYDAARALPPGEIARTFLHGARADASAAAYLASVAAGLAVLSAWTDTSAWVRRAMVASTLLLLAACSLIVVADAEIFAHWERRIDAAALAAASTPAEAWASTGGSPRLALAALAAVLATAGALMFARGVWPAWRFSPAPGRAAVPVVVLAALLVIPARGGVQKVALTPGAVYFSTYDFANLAASNALWGLADSLRREGVGATPVPQVMPPGVARALVDRAREPAGAGGRLALRTRRPNVLLVIWESASVHTTGALGGRPDVTPRFDALAREGVLFRRFYAAGDRTDKGLVALLSGFPAVPRRPVLKVPRKARSLPLLPADFRRAGYHTSWHYGGDLDFASMRAYVTGTGFDVVAGEEAFAPSDRVSAWGVPDRVVADRVFAHIDAAPAPWLAVWLTLSSHEPFETGEPPRFTGSDWDSRLASAMAYSDDVIGGLVERARARPWWRDTLVVIVADHGRRRPAAGAAAPRRDADHGFRVPMLWVGGAVAAAPQVFDEVASQIDLAPTLLDVTGIGGGARYAYGRSLDRPVRTPYAYYGFDNGFGLVGARGRFVFDADQGCRTSEAGQVEAADELLGRALLQLTHQDYLDR